MINPTTWLLVSNIAIVVGILLTAVGGFGNYYFNQKIDDLKSDVAEERHNEVQSQIQEVQNNIAFLVDERRRELELVTNIRDPRMKDSGRVSVEVVWQDGPILDIADPNDLTSNRITLVAERPDKLFLQVLDSDGARHVLEAPFRIFGRMVQLEFLWSSGDSVIAIIADGQLLKGEIIRGLTIFQSLQSHDIRIAGTFEGEAGSGTIRNVTVYSSKTL